MCFIAMIAHLSMTFYRRNLPHWFPDGHSLFLTWRLYGSLPKTPEQQAKRLGSMSDGRRFVLRDRDLAMSTKGPHWLAEPRIADALEQIIKEAESVSNLYALEAYVIMPNHVHMLIAPHAPPATITWRVKGASARIANRILRRSGKPFWQDESFDHWVRSNAEDDKLRSYIHLNPVAAGLVKRPEDWPWSSAAQKSTG